ncbi:hypothetical protein [Acidovorax sp. NCPPB 3576]|uniref:hypothetical protein n=1 Tax=Acidovorax sp. NCPPB 3576 TaxID=2940488 RepID=UPI00234B1AE7|nr:hypothetical protein [Acidovorax sp. NCPPB 3576]WCM89839.1 hypothetical protein M5C98_07375 [Acidovorax sp. NCPPB 3576]
MVRIAGSTNIVNKKSISNDCSSTTRNFSGEFPNTAEPDHLKARGLSLAMQSSRAPRAPIGNLAANQFDLSAPITDRNPIEAMEIASIRIVDKLLKKSDLRPGDILLYIKEPDNLLPIDVGIAFGHYLGKKLQPQKNRGEHNIIHAALWTKNPKHAGNTQACGEGEPEVVEAHVGNSKKTHAVIGTAIAKGEYFVYRPKNENLGDWASQIAMVWSSKRNVPYSLGKVVKAGLKSLTEKGSNFNSVANARAEMYMNEAFDANPSWKKEGSFCSHLVIAAYQAAFLNLEQLEEGGSKESSSIESKLSQHTEFNVNASRTTPLNLHHLLQNGDAFEQIGKIKISKSDVLYGSP